MPSAADLAQTIAVRWVADHLSNLPHPDLDRLADIGNTVDGEITAAVVADAQRRIPQVIAALQRHLSALTDPTPDTPEEASDG